MKTLAIVPASLGVMVLLCFSDFGTLKLDMAALYTLPFQ
jgi:hypothetical protein